MIWNSYGLIPYPALKKNQNGACVWGGGGGGGGGVRGGVGSACTCVYIRPETTTIFAILFNFPFFHESFFTTLQAVHTLFFSRL